MPHYKKVFTSREVAMQEKTTKSLPNLYVLNSETIYYQQDLDETYYPATDFVEFTYTVNDVFKKVLEEPQHVKIYRFITIPNHDLTYAPIDHDYKRGLTISLYPVMSFNKGELYNVKYYSDAAKTDLILDVSMAYVRDVLGFPQTRTVTRTWFREDGSSASPTKLTTKIYPDNLTTYLNEGVRRRGNLIDILTAEVLQFRVLYEPLQGTETSAEKYVRIVNSGRKFKRLYDVDFDTFIKDAYRDGLVSTIESAGDAWLDIDIVHLSKTIRQYILDEISV